MKTAPSLRQRVEALFNIKRAVSLIWQIAPAWVTFNTVLVILLGLQPLASLYLMRGLFASVSAGLAHSGLQAALQGALVWLGLLVLVNVLAALCRAFIDYCDEALTLQVTDSVADILHDQSIAVDLGYYESAGYYDSLHRAQKEAPYRPGRIISNLILIAQSSISLIGISGLILTFNWAFGLILFSAAIPGAVMRLWHSRRLYLFENEHTEMERLSWYYHTVLTESGNAKEVRLFELGGFFKERYQDLRLKIRRGRLALARSRSLSDMVTQTAATLALFGTLAWIAGRSLKGSISIGDLAVYYLAFQSGLGYIQSMLGGLGGLYEDNLFITNLFQFLELKPQVTAPERPRPVPLRLKRGLVFEDVHFTYPGSDRPSLQGINLHIAPGEVIALVGENGSGKTTLVKLLCRLHDPSRGSIRADDNDLRDFDPLEWRRSISVVFQDYVHYSLLAWENIWVGDIRREAELPGIQSAGRITGADEVIRRLSLGYDTPLGKWFNHGQELSTGEWQKIALARSFWRQSGIIVLDEPTSSLDPLAEAEVFNHFRRFVQGRSAILISHRFSTVQMADTIYVLQNGIILEKGSHKDLVKQGGQYAHLYRVQAENYRQGKSKG